MIELLNIFILKDPIALDADLGLRVAQWFYGAKFDWFLAARAFAIV